MAINCKKEFNKCKKYYLDNVNTEGYKLFVSNKKQIHLGDDKDYYNDEDILLTEIHFVDTLSNKGVSKLIKRIHNLPSKDYSSNCHYRKPNLFYKPDYVHVDYYRKSYGRFADIKFLHDEYIDSISISSTQLSNLFMTLEYKIYFKKRVSLIEYNKFIEKGLAYIDTNKDFYSFYFVDDNRKNINYDLVYQMNEDYFSIICQHYITSLFYSENAKFYLLPNLTYVTRHRKIDEKTFYKPMFGRTYYSKKENFFIVSELDGCTYTLYAGESKIPGFCFLNSIYSYGTSIFNLFFEEREADIFAYRFSKYITNRRKLRYNEDFRWLLLKMHSLNDYSKNNDELEFYKKFDSNWIFYLGEKKESLKKYHKKIQLKFDEIYEKNFNFLRTEAEINYTYSNKLISIVAVLIAIGTLLYTIYSNH